MTDQNTPSPTPTEALRQQTLVLQTAARAKVAKEREVREKKKTAAAAREKKGLPPRQAKTKTAKKRPPAKTAAAGKITLLAKSNPHEAGSKRHQRWSKLKTGMAVADAVAAGVPSIYLKRMAARGLLKMG
jgi:hypothetical protein